MQNRPKQDANKQELLQMYHKEELFGLIDANREYLRKWLVWVDKRKSADDFNAIIPQWLKSFAD